MVPMTETANDLVLKCTAIARTGADFPTIWEYRVEGGTLLSLIHPFRFLMMKSVPNLKFGSSTVNVSPRCVFLSQSRLHVG
jgi:hypothetical protein